MRFNSENVSKNIMNKLNEDVDSADKSTNLEEIENDLMHIEMTLQEIYNNMGTHEGEAVIQDIYDLLANKANYYGIDPYKEN